MTYLHVDVDGVDSWDTEVDPDAVAVDEVAVQSRLSGFSVVRIEKFHQAPVLDDSFGHGNLEKNAAIVST